MTFRGYHGLGAGDRSGLVEQIGAQHERVRARLATVGRVVAVASGKGGVGKSYLTAAIALAAARRLAGGVGVLDADLKSPTTAQMLGARGPLIVGEHGVEPARGRGGVAVMSSDLLLEDSAPLSWTGPAGDRFTWRGLLETGALREFLSDVVWGPLDLLLVDLPPDADRLEDLAALVPSLAGAVMVTIPSEASRRSVARAMRHAQRAGVTLLGVVENMSGYACGSCGADGPLFPGEAGARLAEASGAPLLGRVPWLHADPGTAVHPSLEACTDALLAALA